MRWGRFCLGMRRHGSITLYIEVGHLLQERDDAPYRIVVVRRTPSWHSAHLHAVLGNPESPARLHALPIEIGRFGVESSPRFRVARCWGQMTSGAHFGVFACPLLNPLGVIESRHFDGGGRGFDRAVAKQSEGVDAYQKLALPGWYCDPRSHGSMNRSSLARRIASLLGIAAIVFAQVALAVHHCDAPRIAHVSMTAPCHSTSDAPACPAHCEDQVQTVDSLPIVASFDFVPTFALRLYEVDKGVMPCARLDPALHHATSPPASIRNCCLRV